MVNEPSDRYETYMLAVLEQYEITKMNEIEELVNNADCGKADIELSYLRMEAVKVSLRMCPGWKEKVVGKLTPCML